MTSQLLILGNGFDLHCGLKSSYKEFFRKEILDTTTENFGIIQLKPNVSGFWENLLLEYYKRDRNLNCNWCDVEHIIKNTLCGLGLGISDMSSALESVLWHIYNNRIPEFSPEDDPIEMFLFGYCYNFFRNFPSHDAEFTEEYKIHLLIKHLLGELKNFERRFCKYIKKNIVRPEYGLNTDYLLNAMNLLASLTGLSSRQFCVIGDIVDERKQRIQKGGEYLYKRGLTCDFDNYRDIYVLSFNYTAIFDILLVDSPCKYTNVHGKLCNKFCAEDCDSSSIIFGIDDKLIQSNSKYNELRVFSKTYRKMFATSEPKIVLPKNDAPVDIKFYGHSLNEADYSYFQSIFDYYNLYGNNDVTLTFYYSEGYEQTDAIYSLINEYGKTLTNKDQGKNLMHKLLLENRLKIAPIL